MTNEEKLEYVGIKMSTNFLNIIDEYIKRDTHTTRSEFIRTAIREKIKRDAPNLWKQVMKEINKQKN